MIYVSLKMSKKYMTESKKAEPNRLTANGSAFFQRNEKKQLASLGRQEQSDHLEMLTTRLRLRAQQFS